MSELTGTRNVFDINQQISLKEPMSHVTFPEMRSAPGAEDLNEDRAVFALPALAGLVQSPGIAVNQLLANSFSPAGLRGRGH